MNKDYVAKYAHLEINHWWFIIRQKIILQLLQKYVTGVKNTSYKILNVGAAGGASSKWLSQFGEVYSLEYDTAFTESLLAQNIAVVQGSITSIPFSNNEFDLVCAFDVIEHVKDDEKAFAELQRVCKPAGKICITVPAYQFLWSRHDNINEHQRRYTNTNLKKLVSKQPYNKIIYRTYFNTILFLPIFLVRIIENIFKKNPDIVKSDFEYYQTSSFINMVLQKIFSVELFLLKFIRLPFGVSLLMLVEKFDNKLPEQTNYNK